MDHEYPQKVVMNPRIGYHVRALDFRFLLGGRGLWLGLGIEDFELLEKAATESEHFIAARANCSICHNEWIDGRKHFDESTLLYCSRSCQTLQL